MPYTAVSYGVFTSVQGPVISLHILEIIFIFLKKAKNAASKAKLIDIWLFLFPRFDFLWEDYL